MSKWRSESVLLTRYLGSGALNTIVGFSVILVLMAWGMSPLLANISGYFVGFVLGFVVSKKFVFRSNGHFVAESVRYLVAFIISFLFNLLVLRLTLNYMNFHVVTSQVAAASSYTLLMYILTRLFVFDTMKYRRGH
jgi:putative flippase GtrA